MNYSVVLLALSLFLIGHVNCQCSYDNAESRTDCGYAGISSTACISRGCCWDNSQTNQIWCFNPNSEEDREGKGERETANQYNLTTAAIQFAGPCLFFCTSIERRMRLSLTNQLLGLSECLTIGGCYDDTDTIFARRCFHPSRTISICPEPQCQIPSGNMQRCSPDNVLESTCTSQGCCYTRVQNTFKCYRSEDPAVVIVPTEAPTTTKEPTFIDMLRQNTGGDLRGFSVVDLLSNSLTELSQRKRNRTLFPPTTTTTTQSTTTTTTIATTTRQPVPPTTEPPPTRRRVCRWGRCQFVNGPPPPPRQCFPMDCGRPRIFPGSPIPLPDLTPPSPTPSLKKIVGGTRAYPFSYPWMAMLIKTEGESSYLCGATVICDRWLITAAHCFNKQSFESSTPDLDAIFYTLHVGRYTGWKQKPGNQVQTFRGRDDIAYVQPHPDFISGVNRGILENDIGLIRLLKPIIFDNYAQPACMPRVRPVVSRVLFATGWGEYRGEGDDNSGLKQLGVRILNETFCQRNVRGFENPPGVLCGGGEPSQDTCVGDSGGPMVGPVPVGQDRAGNTIQRWLVYGLTSIGSPSCNTREFDRQPAVYTDVSYFSSWIRETTQNCCL